MDLLYIVVIMLIFIITWFFAALAFTGNWIGFLLWGMFVLGGYAFTQKEVGRRTEELVANINSGKYTIISAGNVRQIGDKYFEVGQDGKFRTIENIEHVSEDGTVYCKPNDEETIDHGAGEDIYVLNGKHYIDTGDGTLREVQIQPAS